MDAIMFIVLAFLSLFYAKHRFTIHEKRAVAQGLSEEMKEDLEINDIRLIGSSLFFLFCVVSTIVSLFN